MKLWKKVSLLCGTVLILVAGICLTILIVRSRENVLNLTYRHAEQKQQALVTSFQNMLRYYHQEHDSEVATRSLVKYCFSQYADDEAVLIYRDETVSSNLTFDPSDYLSIGHANDLPYNDADDVWIDEDDKPQRFVGAVNGKRLLIVGSSVDLPSEFSKAYSGSSLCRVYLVQDISSVYAQLRATTGQFLAIGAVCILIGLVCIALLVRRALRPLQTLQNAASRIAAGGYSERVPVSSNDEVGALSRNFNAMAASVEQRIDELTETTERQRLFIGGVTHEFKTPLTALLLNADSLQNTYMEEDEQIAALSRIKHQANWLERLVQKLLKLITLKEKPKKEPVSVPLLLERVRESTSDTLAARGVSLETDCRVEQLELDADLMQSVLINLIDNASKASKEGQTVTVTADAEGFAVSDYGCGIPQAEIDRITEPFYMVDRSRSKKLGGVGLGLALVKEIVKAHNGRLLIESEVGKGTTVRVLLQS